MNGLAAAILVVMGLMLAGGAALFGWLGSLVGRAAGWRAEARRWATALGAVAGLGVGALLCVATFMETTWAPPPTVQFTGEGAAANRWVVLLEDPRAPTVLAWSGVEAPFLGVTTRVAVGPSGVVRVRSLNRIAGRGDVRALWPDGVQATGMSAGPAPAGTGARTFVGFERGPWRGPEDDLPMGDDLAAWIRAREGR